MAMFNESAPKPPASPVRTGKRPTAATHEGAPGYARDAKSELFLMAVTNMVGDYTFYENTTDRDKRCAYPIGEVTVEEPEWMSTILPRLRGEGELRLASLVGALETAAAMVAKSIGGGRQLVYSLGLSRRADAPFDAAAGRCERDSGRRQPCVKHWALSVSHQD